MLSVPSCPIIKRLLLNLADELCSLRAFPQAGVAMLPGASDPPTLPRQAIGLANHEHCKLRLSALVRFVVDKTQDLAQGAHFRARKVMAEEPKHFGIADRQSRLRGCDQDRPDLGRVRQQSGFAHCGCCATGVSSKTSSLDVLWGHGMTRRHLNGPIRSRTPAMSRFGSSP